MALAASLWHRIPRMLSLSITSTCNARRIKLSTDATTANNDCPGPGPPSAPPANLCCMSGCANCVWLDYAEQVLDYYKSRGDDHGAMDVESILEEIDSGVEDNLVKAFVKTEVRMMANKMKNKQQ